MVPSTHWTSPLIYRGDLDRPFHFNLNSSSLWKFVGERLARLDVEHTSRRPGGVGLDLENPVWKSLNVELVVEDAINVLLLVLLGQAEGRGVSISSRGGHRAPPTRHVATSPRESVSLQKVFQLSICE